MADEVRDALMKLTIKGSPVVAEGTAVIGRDDTLAKGFVPGTKDNRWQGNFFAVTDYQFQIGLLADTDSDPTAVTKQTMDALRESLKNPQAKPKNSQGQFARFMDRPPGGSMRAYSSNLEPVTITKQLDQTSLALFDACIKSTTIDNAVLIKRRGSGFTNLATYLRFEFTDVLITDLNWDEDDVVKEKITFVCRKAEVQYRMEKFSGELDAVLPKQTWSVLNLKS